MWHILGNLIAAPIFAVIGAIGAVPLVMFWSVSQGRTDAEMIVALVVITAIVFLAVLFTPKSKGGLFRGLWLSGILLVAGAGLTLAGIWGDFFKYYERTDTREKAEFLFMGNMLSTVPIIALAIGLIFVLLSLRRRKPRPAPDQSS